MTSSPSLKGKPESKEISSVSSRSGRYYSCRRGNKSRENSNNSIEIVDDEYDNDELRKIIGASSTRHPSKESMVLAATHEANTCYGSAYYDKNVSYSVIYCILLILVQFTLTSSSSTLNE